MAATKQLQEPLARWVIWRNGGRSDTVTANFPVNSNTAAHSIFTFSIKCSQSADTKFADQPHVLKSILCTHCSRTPYMPLCIHMSFPANQ